ncbi:MAG: Re/Si-specific NAD(P)(+) transhydrogenase subunit alpha [Planctomycetota bacterium]|jgi:NAD(P) transhydrogenase subunit alpha|nr:Re/Si-specific NAD(P)(+) transhydrogenase subunit alpha [Blastopirellula sp.]
MIIGIPRESGSGECRVAATPESVKKLIKLGYQVQVEADCGGRACFQDEQFVAAGAKVSADRRVIWGESDLVLKVLPPTTEEAGWLKAGATLASFVWPAVNKSLVDQLASRNVTVLAMDCVPRVSRAQKLDALSSMANIAGYRAVVEAAGAFGSFFTGQITAAGKVPPAKVLVIGAGVAGLSAIGTARGLGAIVRAFDTRPAVKEQVQSMGAEFLELDFKEDGEGAGGYAKVMSPEFIKAEMDLFARQAKEVDIIVTTALIPGKPAPKLITAEMVRSMRPGSVIVDMAAEQGGNCELTKPGEKICAEGVTIIGYTDLPSRLPTQSSTLYANNLVNLLTDMTPAKDGQLVVNMDDQVIRGTTVAHQGAVTWPPPQIVNPSPTSAAAPAAKAEVKHETTAYPKWLKQVLVGGGIALISWILAMIGLYAPPDFVGHFTVFVLSCFIGWQVVWNVTPALHTPLMSVTNAISGIIVVGGIMQVGAFGSWGGVFGSILAALAVLIATVNIVGGFMVTQRMLGMFRKQG